MVKKFHLTVPKKNREIVIEDVPNPFVVNPEVKANYRNFPAFYAFPDNYAYDELLATYIPSPIFHWQYVDHRQMDAGRAIAKGYHPRKRFVERVGDLWEFAYAKVARVPNPNYDPTDWKNDRQKISTVEVDTYYVEWNGVLPFPAPSFSTTTFLGRDSFMWAVYFLVNGFPDDDKWFPIPSKYPEWNSLGIGELVPDYVLPSDWYSTYPFGYYRAY